uniref:DRBM domain-containing protein n=1 Tax=Kryptolebias marmoratus TaxID=37003 RepID=A0A3Q3A0W7_KRYMA
FKSEREAEHTLKECILPLNELRPGLQYRLVSQTGPVHAPVFSIAVEVNGLTFEGTGPTKKKAKMRAAELAHLAMGNISNPSADFTSDQPSRTRHEGKMTTEPASKWRR